MNEIDIFALGELLIDFVQENENETGYPVLSAYPGGAPCNFLGVNARYGNRCKLLSSVGDDEFGKKLLATLKENNIGFDFIQIKQNCFTTLAFVTLDESGNREFSFARKPGADVFMECNDRVLDAVKRSRLVHYGSLSFTDEPACGSSKKIVDCALKNNVWVNYDPNYRSPLWTDKNDAVKAILWGINHTNSMKISEEEVEFIFGKCDEVAYEKILNAPNMKYAFITRGSGGVTGISKDGRFDIKGYKLENTIDTTGAGDIFGGSVIYHLMKNCYNIRDAKLEELKRAAMFANAAAALSTTRHGGITSIPSIKEVYRFIANQNNSLLEPNLMKG